jgi:DNA-binding CsgD family transcriptional regulator/ATP-dependent Clp protease adapter protein ClpS
MYPLWQTIAHPQLIARALQLEALSEILNSVRSGHGRCVVVTGEAGIGKSRLLHELSAGATGFWLLQGSCSEDSDGVAYAPLQDLFRRHLSGLAADKQLDALGPWAGELARLLPELAWTLTGVESDATLTPDLERQRLFDALMQFLMRLAAIRPALIIIEDINWSDEASLEFLHLLARRLATLPICLLLTTRPDTGRVALDRFLSRLNRERLAVEMALPPLTRDGVDAMLRSLFDWDSPVKRPLLDAIVALTEGNPYFVEEVARALVDRGDLYPANGRWHAKPVAQLEIPHSLRLIVQGHLRGLSAEAADLLALAAVAGRRFDFDLLLRLTSHDEATLLRLVRELMAAGLVMEQEPDIFAFRHALTREAIYSGLLGRERRNQHRVIATYLAGQTGAGDELLPQLAYHSFEAGLWQQALDCGMAAGDQALRRYATHAALVHLDRAASAANHLDVALPRRLLETRGRARQMVGDFAAARTDFEAALAEARATRDRSGEWQALYDLGYLWMTSDYARAGTYLREALAVARSIDDPTTLARSLNRLGNWLANIGQPITALELHEEALSIIERGADKADLAHTLDLIATAHDITGNNAVSSASYRRALPLFEALGDRQGMASTLMMVTSSGDIDAGLRAATIAREIGWRDGEAYAHIRLAFALGFRGDFGAALSNARQGLEIARQIDHLPWQTAGLQSLGTVYLHMLLPTEGRGPLVEALTLARAGGATVWVDTISAVLAMISIQAGDVDQAAALVTESSGSPAALETLGKRLLALAQGETALAQQDPEAALSVVNQVLATLPDLETWQDRVLPMLLHLQGRALAVAGQPDKAQTTLTKAIRLCRTYAMRPLQWRCHAELARLALTRKDHGEAAAHLNAANELIAALAASIDPDRLRRDFLDAATAALPVLLPLTALQQGKLAAGGLTQREREVALLVAQGKTNPEIAAELFIAVRTVKSHITNILTKIDLSSRSQLAVWVVETGLERQPDRGSG